MKVNRRRFLQASGAATAIAASHGASARARPGYKVDGLKVEFIERPMGLEVEKPGFSWRSESADRNVRQTAYRITVASSADRLNAGRTDLWDSGKVESDASVGIAYDGRKLTTGQRAWWRVEAWDNLGRRAVSQPEWFEMGLLSPSDWHGDWIEAETESARADRLAGLQWIWDPKALDARPHRFRLTIDIDKPLDHADLLVSGKDHLNGVWVNGRKVDHSEPLLGHFGKYYFGTMVPFNAPLKQGRNVVAVEVTADTEGFFPVDGGAMAALIRLHFRDGTIRRLVSDDHWKVMPDAPDGWTAIDFNDRNWPTAQKSGSDAQNDPRPPEPAMQLRRAFRLTKPVARARLYATALGSYIGSLNGNRIGKAVLSPEISVARDHIFYQVHDVTSGLRPGDNVLGMLVGGGWYASAFGWRLERYGFGPAPRRLLAQLVIDYADGSQDVIATGPDWQMTQSPILSSEIYHGERYDARDATPGWDRPGFDASGWRHPHVGSVPHTKIIPLVSPPIRPTRELQPVAVTRPAPGKIVFDFGQNFAGWARLNVTGPAGATVTMRFGELLKDDGTIDQINLRGADATDHYTLAGTAVGEVFEPHFTYHGFRYVQVEGLPDNGATATVSGIVAHSDCPETGLLTFEKQPLLQKIWHNALWSQRSNFFAVPTDCPQRDERMGWMGDIQVFLDAACFNMEVDGFIRRFLREVRAAQRPDGAYPIVVPQPLSFPDVVTAGWSEAGIILPWTLWRRYADTRVIDENWDAMTGWMDYVGRNSPDHIWRTGRGLDLGDWLSVDAVKPDDETTPRILCATAYYAYVAKLMAEMAGATGRDADAERYAALEGQIRDAFARAFVKSDGTVGNGSQTSYVLALHFGLVPDALRAPAAAKLAADIKRRGMHLSTGFLGTPYLLDVLADNGQRDAVAGLLLQTSYPSWGYMPTHGATTVWERWNGDKGDVSMNSYNHYAFGAVVGFMYRRLAAMAPGSAGFATLDVDPWYDHRIGPVHASYDSIMGKVRSRVSGNASGMNSLELTVPANTRATVRLPVGDWRENGRALDRHPDIKVATDGDAILLTTGSGTYHFTRN